MRDRTMSLLPFLASSLIFCLNFIGARGVSQSIIMKLSFKCQVFYTVAFYF